MVITDHVGCRLGKERSIVLINDIPGVLGCVMKKFESASTHGRIIQDPVMGIVESKLCDVDEMTVD